MASTFQFPHLPITDHKDATANLERLQAQLRAGLGTTFLTDGSVTEPKLANEAVTTGKIKNEAVTEGKLAAAVVAKLNPGVWTALTLGPKIEANATYQTPRCRTEQGVVRLRGALNEKAGEELKGGETLATLPEGFRPPGKVLMGLVTKAAGVVTLQIETTGVMFTSGLPLAATVLLDGITFNLT